MKKILGLIAISVFAFALPATAAPNPAACIAAIGGAAGKTINGLDAEIKKAKDACEVLRFCKYSCQSTKKAAKRLIKNAKKSCMAGCKKLKVQGKLEGKTFRACKKGCKQAEKVSKLDLKQAVNDADMRRCRSSCKFPKGGQTTENMRCFDARKELSRKAIANGLEQSGAIFSSCL